MLYGSSIVPALIYIGNREWQLGEVVRAAFADSALTVEGWNDLPPLDREARLAKKIYELRDAAEQAANRAP